MAEMSHSGGPGIMLLLDDAKSGKERPQTPSEENGEVADALSSELMAAIVSDNRQGVYDAIKGIVEMVLMGK